MEKSARYRKVEVRREVTDMGRVKDWRKVQLAGGVHRSVKTSERHEKSRTMEQRTRYEASGDV